MSVPKVERLLDLVAALLHTERPLTAEQLRERIPGYPEDKDSFKRAFERDKKDLRDMGVPLRIEPLPGAVPPEEGYRIDPDEYYLPDPGLEVAAEGVAGGDRAVDEPGTPHGDDQVGQGQRQRRAVGHHVRDPRVGPPVEERRRHDRHLAVERAHHHGRAAQVGRDVVGLLGRTRVALQRRVPHLHDVARAGLHQLVAGQVPVHDVPAAGAEAELDGGGVQHHAVADGDRAHQLGEHVGPAGVGVDPLEAVALGQHLRDGGGVERRHRYRLAMRRSTRSSDDLNGSLHSTVRCAWSLSFRCTQSTV